MKRLEVELPDKLAGELGALVQGGWFQSEGEVVRAALVEFVRRHRLELLEKQQTSLGHSGKRASRREAHRLGHGSRPSPD